MIGYSLLEYLSVCVVAVAIAVVYVIVQDTKRR